MRLEVRHGRGRLGYGSEKHYGSLVAVEDVSFEVAEGEIFGLLGPNGAGKTTTVECLQGLRRPDGGRLRVLGLTRMPRPASFAGGSAGNCRSRPCRIG